jgi:hypothetical protein
MFDQRTASKIDLLVQTEQEQVREAITALIRHIPVPDHCPNPVDFQRCKSAYVRRNAAIAALSTTIELGGLKICGYL